MCSVCVFLLFFFFFRTQCTDVSVSILCSLGPFSTAGAVLMNEPALVASCMQAMIEAVPAEVPCTVKCRIGVDVR